MIVTGQHQQRALSMLLVLLLHAMLLLVLLRFTVQKPIAVPERLLEMIIRMPKLPPPAAPPAPAQELAPVPLPNGLPAPPVLPLAPPIPAPDISGLGRAIFGCAPENLSNLLPDQRARCPSAFVRPDQSAMVEPKSHVKNPQRRAAELSSRNTPGRVPCSYIATEAKFGYKAPGLELDCLANGVFGSGLPPVNGLPK